jgi:hypothetical protein
MNIKRFVVTIAAAIVLITAGAIDTAARGRSQQAVSARAGHSR